jgi:hypothetical protein
MGVFVAGSDVSLGPEEEPEPMLRSGSSSSPFCHVPADPYLLPVVKIQLLALFKGNPARLFAPVGAALNLLLAARSLDRSAGYGLSGERKTATPTVAFSDYFRRWFLGGPPKMGHLEDALGTGCATMAIWT